MPHVRDRAGGGDGGAGVCGGQQAAISRQVRLQRRETKRQKAKRTRAGTFPRHCHFDAGHGNEKPKGALPTQSVSNAELLLQQFRAHVMAFRLPPRQWLGYQHLLRFVRVRNCFRFSVLQYGPSFSSAAWPSFNALPE